MAPPERQRRRPAPAGRMGRRHERAPARTLIYAARCARCRTELIRRRGQSAGQITSAPCNPVYRACLSQPWRRGGLVRHPPIGGGGNFCSTVARQALDAAILDLTDRYGPDVTSWRWGDAHEAVQMHPALVRSRVWAGSPICASRCRGRHDAGPRTGRGRGRAALPPDHRGRVSRGFTTSPIQTVRSSSSPSGSRGIPSRHYDDLAVKWRRGEYITMSLDPDLARAAAAGSPGCSRPGPRPPANSRSWQSDRAEYQQMKRGRADEQAS